MLFVPRYAVLRGLVVFAMCLVVLTGACSQSESVPPAGEPGAFDVVDPTPDSSLSAAQDPAESEQAPLVAPTPQPLDESAFSLVTTARAGETIADGAGHLITVHSFAEWPEVWSRLGAFNSADYQLAAGVEQQWQGAGGIGGVDVSMCAPGDIAQAERATRQFSVVGSLDAPLESPLGAGLYGAHPVLEPAFVFPEPGACSRGWIPIALADAANNATVARVEMALDAADPGRSELMQWELDSVADVPEITENVAGITAQFVEGPLAGASATLLGWAEFIESESPWPGTRLVGALIDACPGRSGWPLFGLEVEQWNLAPTVAIPVNSTAPAATLSGDECTSGWIAAPVPFGAEPTGLFMTDLANPESGFASWSFAGSALPAPG